MKLFLLFFCVITIQISGFAQPPNDPNSDPDVPITGIEILIGAGALLGARKIASLRSKK
jgi:hypothetical protein